MNGGLWPEKWIVIGSVSVRELCSADVCLAFHCSRTWICTRSALDKLMHTGHTPSTSQYRALMHNQYKQQRCGQTVCSVYRSEYQKMFRLQLAVWSPHRVPVMLWREVNEMSRATRKEYRANLTNVGRSAVTGRQRAAAIWRERAPLLDDSSRGLFLNLLSFCATSRQYQQQQQPGSSRGEEAK